MYSTSGRCLVGNDIVDVNHFEMPLYRHVEYLDRICSKAEAQALRQSATPCRNLAIVWAAKEAAFKLSAKRSTQRKRHFHPREFVTNFAEIAADPLQELEVRFDGERVRIDVHWGVEWIHAVAAAVGCRYESKICRVGGTSGVQPENESREVRRLASEILAERGWKDVYVKSDGPVPTLNRSDESDVAMDVSLSHHGGFAAAVIAWPAQERVEKQLDWAAQSVALGDLCCTYMG